MIRFVPIIFSRSRIVYLLFVYSLHVYLLLIFGASALLHFHRVFSSSWHWCLSGLLALCFCMLFAFSSFLLWIERWFYGKYLCVCVRFQYIMFLLCAITMCIHTNIYQPKRVSIGLELVKSWLKSKIILCDILRFPSKISTTPVFVDSIWYLLGLCLNSFVLFVYFFFRSCACVFTLLLVVWIFILIVSWVIGWKREWNTLTHTRIEVWTVFVSMLIHTI